MSNLTQLDTSFRFYRGRAMDAEELKAAASLTAIPAPLGLTEWRTTDGTVYAKGANAVDVQVGINRRKAETTHHDKNPHP